jgi:NNP family nitrate/nitrite transporter-like MFS transporter
MKDDVPPGNPLQLGLATTFFALCFAVFGSVSAMMSHISSRLDLTDLQAWIAIALPVLLGSVGRIPLGLWADRAGARVVCIWTMVFSIICGFFVGIALASFAPGVTMASRWYPPAAQGKALGIYGAGNIGQSLAVFGAPVAAAAWGYVWGFWVFAILLGLLLVLFVILGKDAPVSPAPKTLRQQLEPLRVPATWRLATYYFLTFGGFVAMGISLPRFLTTMFGLEPADAGLRTAGFIVLATLLRPVGGVLSDRIGGARVLMYVFPAVMIAAIFLACPRIETFTIGALGMAAAIGLGNGAVFKLVPQYFPQSVGVVTGLVGAAGGLGGFFPPLLVGSLKQATGVYYWGFILLAVFAAVCWRLIATKGRNPFG